MCESVRACMRVCVCAFACPLADYISPSCIFTWTYYRSYALTVSLPIITAAIMAFRHFVLHHNQDRCVASFLSFLVIVYNGLCFKGFGTFLCEAMIDGSQMLLADPSVTCWEGSHTAVVVVSIALVFLYVIGIPTGFLILLRYGRQRDKLRDPNWLGRYGFLYLRYESDMYLWEIVLLMRRFALCALQALLYAQPHLQLIGGLVVVAFAGIT